MGTILTKEEMVQVITLIEITSSMRAPSSRAMATCRMHRAQ
jgi:hypothetical protein